MRIRRGRDLRCRRNGRVDAGNGFGGEAPRGVEIRSGADVIEIRVKDGAANGVVLSTGEEIDAKAVVSNCDPKRTLLKLTDPLHLSPDFVQKLQHYRGNGTVAKVNLALSAANFQGFEKRKC